MLRTAAFKIYLPPGCVCVCVCACVCIRRTLARLAQRGCSSDRRLWRLYARRTAAPSRLNGGGGGNTVDTVIYIVPWRLPVCLLHPD